MPTYDYECAACGRRFEVVHGVHADGPTACPLCGNGPVRKVITAANVHYKGSGWAKKERRSAVTSGAAKDAAATGSDDADGTSTDAAASSDSGASGPSTKKSGAASTDGASSKKTDKPSKSSASKTSD
jgi:putative FmdB family regulatory protein